jgi:hypothetical protein
MSFLFLLLRRGFLSFLLFLNPRSRDDEQDDSDDAGLVPLLVLLLLLLVLSSLGDVSSTGGEYLPSPRLVKSEKESATLLNTRTYTHLYTYISLLFTRRT